MTETAFSLELLEDAAYSRRHEEAAREMARLLDLLNRNYGSLREDFSFRISALLDIAELDSHIVTRLCSAITCLFSDPSFHLSDTGYGMMISWQRWIAALFAASPFRNTDHIIRLLNLEGATADQLKLDQRSILKFCLLYSPESEIPVDLNNLWNYNKGLAACLAFVLMSPRFLGSPAAHGKREVLLEWLPSRLDEIDDLSFLPVGILHDVYMHCSYADLSGRHAIKAPINRLIRKKLDQLGITDLPSFKYSKKNKRNDKPVMMVVLEWFSSEHSIYRTHSLSMEGCKQHFHLVGLGDATTVDAAGRAVFDEFIEIQAGDAVMGTQAVRAAAQRLGPAVLYMPSVGMFPLTLFVTNLRLAPVQLVALGHPATTRSEYVDFIVVEEDYVGDPACFSEKLMRLPPNGMPYRPSAAYVDQRIRVREAPEVVSIAVASSLMKLNPAFLEACKAIAEGSAVPVQFHFLLGFGQGFVFIQARNLIRLYLPDAVIYPHQPYAQYLEVIGRCDMYINPFPFGNTNGLVDMTHLGLVGVCKAGPEVFEHIDAALFRRLGLPAELIADSVESYVNAAVKLANDHSRRFALRQVLLTENAVERLFEGDPLAFGNQLSRLAAR
jgi:HMW1C N-terminal/HMW1 domain 2